MYDARMLLDEMEETIPWNIRIHIAQSGAERLGYLHSKSIIHRDVKAANFLPLEDPLTLFGQLRLVILGKQCISRSKRR